MLSMSAAVVTKVLCPLLLRLTFHQQSSGRGPLFSHIGAPKCAQIWNCCAIKEALSRSIGHAIWIHELDSRD